MAGPTYVIAWSPIPGPRPWRLVEWESGETYRGDNPLGEMPPMFANPERAIKYMKRNKLKLHDPRSNNE